MQTQLPLQDIAPDVYVAPQMAPEAMAELARLGFKAVINNYDDALSHLRRLKAVGAFSVKSYNQPRRDQRQQVFGPQGGQA